MRREAEVARAEWAASSAFTPEAFTGRRLDAFVVGLIDDARKLTGRRQSKARERLVVLVRGSGGCGWPRSWGAPTRL